MNRIFRFRPLAMERVWGGRKLESALGRALPGDGPFGESWEVVDRPEAQSVVNGGAFDGVEIGALLEEHGSALLGSGWVEGSRFPILVKWLDCRERLSLQVHPPASVAQALGGEPKTENWYIAGSEPGSRLIVGLKRGVTREAFEDALRGERLEELVHAFPVEPGDSILVESGRLHAIDGGNLILEIQQNSDTTYRVYDWRRLGLDGQPRQLHVEESLASIDFNDFEPEPLRAEQCDQVLADCPEFRICKLGLGDGARLQSLCGAGPALLHVVKGEAVFPETEDGEVTLQRGDNVFLPAGFTAVGKARGETVVLITDRF